MTTTPIVDFPDTVTQLAGRVVTELKAHGHTVATAESLTGGLLGATITEVPGASAVYRGGLVVYATDLKASLAGVDTETLDEEGAVSAGTAAQLARGAARRCGADWGLSTTGVAGPDDQEGHPPGTVFVGIRGPGEGHSRVSTVHLQLEGSRDEIRSQTVRLALYRLLELLQQH